MTRRSSAMVRLSATAAALLLSQQVAFSADTIWDLLHTGDPVRSRAAERTDLSAVAQRAQTGIDPKTGAPRPVRLQGQNPVAPKRRQGFLGFFDNVGNSVKRLGKQLNSDIRIQGQKSIGFHLESVSGGSNALDSYQNDNYYGRRGVGGSYDQTDLTIQGKIGGIINFETRYSNNLYGNPYDNRLSLNYAGKHLKIDAGDITGSITGNSLLDFTRTLKGLQVSADVVKGLKLTTLYSETKAQTRTITINGGNTSGPYYVYAGQIVDGSEHVRVNNRDLIKGEDYTLDPYTGELNFKKGLIVGEMDTIAVTYETYGYNQSAGLITGYRADLTMLKGAKFGMSYLAQTSGNNGNGIRTKTDRFQGYNSPDTPYQLDYPVEIVVDAKDTAGRPTQWHTKYPMTVTVDNMPQIYGVDYTVDALVPSRIWFKLAIPSTKTIIIEYTPQMLDETPGNRSVMGFDYNQSLGKLGSLTAEFANSSLDLSGKSLRDGAWQLRSDMRFLKDKLHWNFALRDIGANFTAIESPGFRRTEKGFSSNFDYALSSALKFNASLEKSKRPSYNYSSLTGSSSNYAQADGWDDFSQLNLGASWQFGKGGSLNLTHSSMDTLMALGGKSSLLNDNLTFAYSLKSLSFDMGIGRNSSSSQAYFTQLAGSSGTTQQISQFATDSLNTRLNMRWRASSHLSLSANLANNRINNSGAGSSNAQDMQLTAELVPMRNMRMTFGYSLQDSGGYSLFNGTTSTGTGATTNTGTGSTTAATASKALLLSRDVTFPYPGTNYGGGYYYPGTGTGTTTGGTTGTGTYTGYPGSTYPGGSSFGNGGTTYLGGGGFNGGLGGYGNYSGGFYNGSYSNYGLGSYGGKSRSINFAWSYQPMTSLSMDFTWNSASSQGDYLYNSKRNDMALNISYTLGERLSLNSSFAVQKVNYIGGSGGTTSNMAFFNIRSRPIGKLITNLSFQMMKTTSAMYSDGSGATGGTTTGAYTGGNPFQTGYGTGTGGYTGYSGIGGTNLNSYMVRLEYPVWRGNNLFFQMDNATSSGFLASTQRSLMMGIDFDLTHNMRFTLGWRMQDHISQDSSYGGSNYTYHVNSLDADLGWKF